MQRGGLRLHGALLKAGQNLLGRAGKAILTSAYSPRCQTFSFFDRPFKRPDVAFTRLTTVFIAGATPRCRPATQPSLDPVAARVHALAVSGMRLRALRLDDVMLDVMEREIRNQYEQRNKPRPP